MFTEAGFDDCFVDQTWSAAKSHMKMMMLSCFPTAKKCVPVSRGRWPKGNRQAIDSFQMLLVKTWWFHDYLILHVLLYIYVHVYIHTCTYVCMYVYIYIYTWFLALQCIGGPNAPSPKREQQPHLSVVINSSPGSRTCKNDVKTMKPIWYCNLANKDGDRIRTLYIYIYNYIYITIYI
jgi:hypothetical protein